MDLTLRAAAPEDAEICGKICYEAFAAIATRHNFPPDFPSPEIAASLLSGLIAHPCFYGAVAERDGRVLGSNFIDERESKEVRAEACVSRTMGVAKKTGDWNRALARSLVPRDVARLLGPSGCPTPERE